MSESRERLVKGDKGERGERGEGMTGGARRAIVTLFALTLALGAANLFWTAHEVSAAGAAQRQEQAVQRRQSAVFEARLCITLGRLAALQPPPGSAPGNPSRAYLQEEHAVLAELGPDVGCGGSR